MRKAIAVIVSGAALSSCVHSRQVPMTGCDHPSGWSEQIRAMAETAHPYAMLAVNAYDDDKDDFAMGPAWVRLDSFPNNQHGMAYDVWQHNGPQGQEIVLAFRGTEFTHLRDWRDGNFGTKQNADGIKAFDAWRAKYPGARSFTVTGHSLGGGIATQISLSRKNVRSFIFNSSPRFKAPRPPAENERVSVAEYGEVLKAVRMLGREATQDYYSIGCRSGNPIAQHASYPLAVCVLRMASWGSPDAAQALRRNNLLAPIAASRPGTADCRRSSRSR